MATRERRLAEFNGEGEPPQGMPLEVLCEDHSGTYQLPFACTFTEGRWQNDEAGTAVEATVIGWRLPRVKAPGTAQSAAPVSNLAREPRGPTTCATMTVSDLVRQTTNVNALAKRATPRPAA
jgi:hypothetical protein